EGMAGLLDVGHLALGVGEMVEAAGDDLAEQFAGHAQARDERQAGLDRGADHAAQDGLAAHGPGADGFDSGPGHDGALRRGSEKGNRSDDMVRGRRSVCKTIGLASRERERPEVWASRERERPEMSAILRSLTLPARQGHAQHYNTPMTRLFHNGTLVLPDRLLAAGHLLVEGERIRSLSHD